MCPAVHLLMRGTFELLMIPDDNRGQYFTPFSPTLIVEPDVQFEHAGPHPTFPEERASHREDWSAS